MNRAAPGLPWASSTYRPIALAAERPPLPPLIALALAGLICIAAVCLA